MTASDVVKRLHADGWQEVSQKGSHKKFRHLTKPGNVTVPMHNGDIPKGTLSNIYRQAGWDKD